MAKRKTIDVARVVDVCNRALALPDRSNEYRNGIISVLEHVLTETGNYAGYNYLAWCVEKGDDGLTGCERWRKDCKVAGVDADSRFCLPTMPYLGNETRRVYYKAHNLHTRQEDKELHYPKRLT